MNLIPHLSSNVLFRVVIAAKSDYSHANKFTDSSIHNYDYNYNIHNNNNIPHNQTNI